MASGAARVAGLVMGLAGARTEAKKLDFGGSSALSPLAPESRGSRGIRGIYQEPSQRDKDVRRP